MLKIEQSDNGYVLSYKDDLSGKLRMISVEESEDGSEAKTTYKLLLEVIEHFCLFGSKHDSERISVKVLTQNGDEVDV